jgi:hypothetical protein
MWQRPDLLSSPHFPRVNATIVRRRIYAKADAAMLRDAIRSLEKLDEDGYRMVTEVGDGNERATCEE